MSFRVPMTRDQLQAVMEAAHGDHETFVIKNLIGLALSYLNSEENEWEWRMEDEDD